MEKSIPVKEETIIEVELTTMQKKWYKGILERNFSWLKQGFCPSSIHSPNRYQIQEHAKSDQRHDGAAQVLYPPVSPQGSRRADCGGI